MKHMVSRLALSAMAMVGFTFAAQGATTIYVDGSSEVDPAAPYGEGTPFKLVKEAVSYASSLADEEFPVEIVVKTGTYTESAMTLGKPIVVRGATGDPKDVVINDTAATTAFTLKDADSAIANLTIQGSSNKSSNGGHVNMTAGMVTNCLVTGGHFNGENQNGANVYMTGGLLVDSTIQKGSSRLKTKGLNIYMSNGRVSRCRILDADVSSSNGAGNDAAVYATGGIIDNCLVKGNHGAYLANSSSYANNVGLDLAGAVTVANCTIVGNGPSASGPCGVRIASPSAKVVNTIIYDNGDTAAKNFNLAYPGCFHYCASSFPIEGGDNCLSCVSNDDFRAYGLGDCRLRIGSPLIGAGAPEGTDLLPEEVTQVDFFGNRRLSGDRYDIGYHEFDRDLSGHLLGYGGYAGQATRFMAFAEHEDGQGVTFEWNFGDGTASVQTADDVIEHEFATPGFYPVTVRAKVGDGEWSAAKALDARVQVVPQAVYVDPKSATPELPFDTKEKAATTLTQALTALADESGVPTFGTIVIVKGASLASSGNAGIQLARPITIRGETGDPSDVVITDGSSRTFTLNNPDAVVAGVTITGRGWQGPGNNNPGGHVGILSGTVTNCVIMGGYLNSEQAQAGNVYMTGGTLVGSTVKGGSLRYKSKGANIYMEGGRVTRCQVLDAELDGTSNTGGLFARGGVIDNCLVRGNKSTKSQGSYPGLYLNGAVTVANCTVVGNGPASGNGVGICLASASAKVVNTVVFDNGDTLAKNVGTANTNNFDYCATAFEGLNETCKTMSEADFAGYSAQDYSLVTSSLLLDAGSKALLPDGCAAVDFSGFNRISGKEIDVGMLEVDQSKVTVSGAVSGYGAYETSNLVFTASSVGGSGEITYEWDFGNGTTQETDQENYSYAYPTSGLYVVRIRASGDGGDTWCDWKTLPTRLRVVPDAVYVDPKCETSQYPYGTKDTAATSLSMAIAAMTNNVSGGRAYFGTIVIVKGASLASSGNANVALDYAITIRGETGDPSDVVITDGGSRTFTLNHPDAVVAGVTIAGSGWQYPGSYNPGGHVGILSGTVTNCVIMGGYVGSEQAQAGNVYMTGGTLVGSTVKGGSLRWKSKGANIYMEGGRVTRCQILGAELDGTSNVGGVYATGGVIDNCLVRGNKSTKSQGSCPGLYLNGAVTVANCTVVGNGPASGNGVGICLASASAKVVNTVVFDNGDTLAKNVGTSNTNNFDYCATAFEGLNATCLTMSEADFAGYFAENYRLALSSELVDGGSPQDFEFLPTVPLSVDFYGNNRLSGAFYDIGLFELDKQVGGQIVGLGGIAGQATRFRAFAEHEDGQSVTFEWNFGDGTASVQTADDVIEHEFATPGFYPVTVRAKVGDGEWSAAKALDSRVQIVPQAVYVDPKSATPELPFDTKEKAATTLVQALTALADESGVPTFGTIVIVKGASLASSGNAGIQLTRPITIRGETGDPADVVITDDGSRTFTLNNPDAVIAGVTIKGKGWQYPGNYNPGGHIGILSGTVTNCVIMGGYVGSEQAQAGNVYMTGGTLVGSTVSGGSLRYQSKGANIYMEGGRVTRCQLLGAELDGNSNVGGVYATGGVIDNCLVRGNKSTKSQGSYPGLYLGGAATVANCTVVGNGPSSGNGVGIAIANASAKVVNTVVYDNGETMVKNVGTANTNKFDYCATAFEGLNETCKVIEEAAFKGYANWLATGDLQFLAPAKGKQLQNGGTTAKEYLATGAVSEKDILGRNRISGRRVDIGALETPNACSYILLR